MVEGDAMRRGVKGTFGYSVLAACVLFVLAGTPVSAETQYISDTLRVGLRNGLGRDAEITKYLESNTAFEVLGEEGDYYNVRTEDGLEGWLPKRYVTSDTPGPVIISRQQGEIERLKKRVDELKKRSETIREELKAEGKTQALELTDLRDELAATEKELEGTSRELEVLKVKYGAFVEASGNVVAIVEERDSLRAENDRLAKVEDSLRSDNEELRRREKIWWFLGGAVVFLVGWLVGKASRQKRYY
jgi:SH3 domain protein